MKFALIALLCIGAAMAQAPTSAPQPNNNASRELVETLEKRAAALLERVKSVLTENRVGGNAFLLGSLERQAVMVEALALDLKKQVEDLAKTHSFHQVHVIEEDLLFLENRVSEEIWAITQAKEQKPTVVSTAELIVRAEKLVKDAKDTVTKFPQAKEIKEINSEIIVIEALIKTIQAKPAPTAAELAKDEQELVRQEKTLQQLIEKASARKP